jgi:hypothetical protein
MQTAGLDSDLPARAQSRRMPAGPRPCFASSGRAEGFALFRRSLVRVRVRWAPSHQDLSLCERIESLRPREQALLHFSTDTFRTHTRPLPGVAPIGNNW